MSSDGWSRWRAAETALAEGADLDVAARDLPPAQEWILRATDALERGDKQAFEALHATAPQAEYAALVEIAVSAPGTLDPTSLRAMLKRSQVPNKPLPRLDLVRLACVAHNGEKPTRPGGLAKASADRIALRAALMVLSPKFTAYQVHQKLVERSPRMARLWAGGASQVIAPGHVRLGMLSNFPELGDLPEDTWPDLEAPIEVGSVSRGCVGLEQILASPQRHEWNARCDDEIDDLIGNGTPQTRRYTLGRLLDAIQQLVQSSRPGSAQPLIGSAAVLAESVPHIVHKEILLGQLHQLDLRLGWVTRALPGSAVEYMWHGLEGKGLGTTADERTYAARAILQGAESLALGEPVLTAMLASAVRLPSDWHEETLPLLRTFGRSISLDRLSVALRGVPPTHRLRIVGTLQALRGDRPSVIGLAAQLLAEGAVAEADGVVDLAMTQADEPVVGRQARRLLRKAVLAYTKAGLACEPPPGATSLIGIFALIAEDPDRSLTKSLVPVVHRRLTIEPSAPYVGIYDHLELLLLAGVPEKVDDLFRAFGRWLRRAPASEAIRSALRFCAAISQSEAILDCYESDGTGDFKRPAGWLHSITQWLEHQSPDAIGAAALSMATKGECDPATLILWFERVSDLPSSAGWERVDELVMKQAFGDMPDMRDLIEMLGSGGMRPF